MTSYADSYTPSPTSRPIWRTSDGRLIPYSQLSAAHLCNILNRIESADWHIPSTDSIEYVLLCNEAHTRGLRWRQFKDIKLRDNELILVNGRWTYVPMGSRINMDLIGKRVHIEFEGGSTSGVVKRVTVVDEGDPRIPLRELRPGDCFRVQMSEYMVGRAYGVLLLSMRERGHHDNGDGHFVGPDGTVRVPVVALATGAMYLRAAYEKVERIGKIKRMRKRGGENVRSDCWVEVRRS